MNTINNIAHNYHGIDYGFEYEDDIDREKSIALEESLYTICNQLAEIEKITGNRNINVEYLLTIVGSYVLGIQDGTLDIEQTEPPSVLFEQSLFPSLANTSTVEKEIIDAEIDDGDDSQVTIGDAPKEPTN